MTPEKQSGANTTAGSVDINTGRQTATCDIHGRCAYQHVNVKLRLLPGRKTRECRGQDVDVDCMVPNVDADCAINGGGGDDDSELRHQASDQQSTLIASPSENRSNLCFKTVPVDLNNTGVMSVTAKRYLSSRPKARRSAILLRL